MKKPFKKAVAVLLCAAMMPLCACGKNAEDPPTEPTEAAASADTVYTVPAHEGYTLKKMVVLSRHNIRSPLSDEGSVLASVTPNDWFDWTSGKSELSLRGGILEAEMGQFFRKYTVANGLMTENMLPTEGEVRIYANSMQRTIATANYFKSGFLPLADIETEYHCELNTMDPVFHPQFTYLSEAFKEQAMAEINALGGNEKLEDLINSLADNYRLLEKILNFAESDYAKENGITEFPMDVPEIQFEMNAEPYMTGTLDLTAAVCDALVLQYYEEPDAVKAAFGYELTDEEWKMIAEISDVYEEIIFASHIVSVNVANPMLKEIRSDLANEDCLFTYLCGHDSNVITVLTALGAEPYTLPGAISKDTPIGCKLVFEIWENEAGEEMICVNLVYQSVDQLRNCDMLSMENPPVFYSLSFSGLTKNADGLYKLADFETLLGNTIDAYNTLPADTVKEAA